MLLNYSVYFLFFLIPGLLGAQELALNGDLRVHDPVMIKEGDTYYIFHTGSGVSIKSSPDMLNWSDYGRVFPQGALPEVSGRGHNGIFINCQIVSSTKYQVPSTKIPKYQISRFCNL